MSEDSFVYTEWNELE